MAKKRSGQLQQANRPWAALTGGATGTSVAGMAQLLDEPYKTWLTFAAPIITAFVGSVWPIVLREGGAWWDARVSEWRIRRVSRKLARYVEEQRKRLNSGNLREEEKREIELRIHKAQQAITEKDFELVADYIPQRKKSATESPNSNLLD